MVKKSFPSHLFEYLEIHLKFLKLGNKKTECYRMTENLEKSNNKSSSPTSILNQNIQRRRILWYNLSILRFPFIFSPPNIALVNNLIWLESDSCGALSVVMNGCTCRRPATCFSGSISTQFLYYEEGDCCLSIYLEGNICWQIALLNWDMGLEGACMCFVTTALLS